MQVGMPTESRPFYFSLREFYLKLDPRIPVAFVLITYLALGLSIPGFYRTPHQALTVVASCITLELVCSWLFNRILFPPLSIFITSLSLSFLLSYQYNPYLLFLPVFYAVASKYILTYNGRHFFNPAGTAVVLSVMTSGKLITLAPASQWNGFRFMPALVVAFGLLFVIPKVKRTWLVGAYLASFLVFGLIRLSLDPLGVSGEVLVWGTMLSTSFLIFTFFMITDPATSPTSPKEQVVYGVSLAFIDFLLHLRHSYFTFFQALLFLTALRFLYFHFAAFVKEGPLEYVRKRFLGRNYYWRPILLGSLLFAGTSAYKSQVSPKAPAMPQNWRLDPVPAGESGLVGGRNGELEKLLDPRVRQMEKMLFVIGDAVAVGDVDGDGLPDVFLTNFLKAAEERCALFRNLGHYKFQRIEVPALRAICDHPETNGSVTQGIFADFDNSGAQSLFLTTLGGHPYLLKNTFPRSGKIEFQDVSAEAGLSGIYTNSVAANFGDFNKDGLLDVIITNILPENLPGYETPHRLNFFHLPKAEYPGDERMFALAPYPILSEATNGGEKILLTQGAGHRFTRQDSGRAGIPEMRWSYAAGVADLNHDNWPDIYGVTDYGPDDVYLNVGGEKFANASRGGKTRRKDINNGMNQSIADFDRDGRLSVYVSNIHHAFFAAGSALWSFQPGPDPMSPKMEDRAAEKGLVNEDRIGWGAVAVDFNNDGWVGIAQANGSWDSPWNEMAGKCADYNYYVEKLGRISSDNLKYVNHWPSTESTCLYANEKNRIYLNRGLGIRPQFVDVAEQVGVREPGTSRAVAAADFDGSGRRGLLFTHLRAEPSFYRNVAGPGNANDWIGFDLESRDRRCNREAIGTRVTITVTKLEEPGFSQLQEKQMLSGLSAQSDKRLHFGLGKGAASVSAEIDWCYGLKTQKITGLGLNRYHKLVLQ